MDKEQQLKQLGQRIRAVRLSKALTQTDLANEIGKDQQSVQRLEAGKVNPSYVYLLEIAKGLDTSVHELIKLD